MSNHRTAATAAFIAALGAIALFSMMDALMKGLTLAIGVYSALFWRSLAAGIISGAIFRWQGHPWPDRPAWRLHLLRGLVNVLMALLFFWGLAHVPLAQAIALTFVAPILALFLAAILLKERISLWVALAGLIAFAGVLVIMAGQAYAPIAKSNLGGVIAILISALLYAWNIVLMRQQAVLSNPVEVAFFQSLIFAVVLALAAPWLAVIPTIAQALPILAAAALAVGSLQLLAWAYARAEANYLATVEYSAFLWAALLGFVVFGERVSLFTLAGAALIVSGCLVAMRKGRNAVVPPELAAS